VWGAFCYCTTNTIVLDWWVYRNPPGGTMENDIYEWVHYVVTARDADGRIVSEKKLIGWEARSQVKVWEKLGLSVEVERW
jgi:hypothetical protein